jgi:hypothetical protein
MNRLIEWLRTDIFILRSSGIGCLVLTFLGACSVFIALGLANNAMSDRKYTPEIATITGFGGYEGRWQAGAIAVSARDSKGRSATVLVQAPQITGCHIGDKIRAAHYAMLLSLEPAPCPIKLEPGEEEASREK